MRERGIAREREREAHSFSWRVVVVICSVRPESMLH